MAGGGSSSLEDFMNEEVEMEEPKGAKGWSDSIECNMEGN